MTAINFREEVRWRWEHLSSIYVYFSSHLCKSIHEIQQAGRSVSVSLLVQVQKQYLLLLLQEKNKYLRGGKGERSIIYMTFSSLKCNPMLKISACVHRPWHRGPAKQWQTLTVFTSWQLKKKRMFGLNYPCLKTTSDLDTKPERL